MGRKNTKKTGALVKLYRRKSPGVGIILETVDTKDAVQFARDTFNIRFKSIDKIKERIGYGALNNHLLGGVINEDQKKLLSSLFMYGADSKNRRFARVQWIQRPSAWETKTITAKSDWYPLDMLRTISAVKV